MLRTSTVAIGIREEGREDVDAIRDANRRAFAPDVEGAIIDRADTGAGQSASSLVSRVA
jgi:hypothetical protein